MIGGTLWLCGAGLAACLAAASVGAALGFALRRTLLAARLLLGVARGAAGGGVPGGRDWTEREADGVRWRQWEPDGAIRGAVVLLHGVTVHANRDPRLLAFAAALRERGLRVAAPELPALAWFRPDARDRARTLTVVRELAEHHGGPVSLLGFSLGGGVALVAAAAASARNVRYVLSVGAHHDLGDLYRDHAGRDEPPHSQPLEWDAYVYFRLLDAHRAGVGLDDERRRALERTLETFCEGGPRVGEEKVAALAALPRRTPAAVLPDELDREALSVLSPAGVLGRISCPVSVLHDRLDPVVRPSHAAANYHELQGRELRRRPAGRQRLLVTGLLSHVGAGQLWRVHELVGLVRAFAELFER